MLRWMRIAFFVCWTYLESCPAFTTSSICWNRCRQQKPDHVLLITKCLYKQTAQHFETTSGCVERNLRTLVRACWRQPDHTLLDQIAGRPLRKPPTNMQFLDMLSAYLRK